MAILAPNAIQALQFFGIGKKKYSTNSYIKTTIGKLHSDGLIRFKQDGENKYVSLTHKGEMALAKHQSIHHLLQHNNKKWDGKWRIVIFDIREKRRVLRDRLREWLNDIGFIKVQNSVWAFPYDCEEFIFLLKTDLQLGSGVLFLVTERLENDKWLKSKFDLT